MVCDTSSLRRVSENNERSSSNWTTYPMRRVGFWEPWSGIVLLSLLTSSSYEPRLTSSPTSYLPNDLPISQPPGPLPIPSLPLPTETHETTQPLHLNTSLTPPHHLTELLASPTQTEWEEAFGFLNSDYRMTSPITNPPTTMETAQGTHQHRRSEVQSRRSRSLPVYPEDHGAGDVVAGTICTPTVLEPGGGSRGRVR